MRHRFLYIFLLALLVLADSCASQRTAEALDDIETYIADRPDSALAAVRAIDTAALTTASLRAHHALLHAMALDKNWIDTTDESIVMPAVSYYDRHGSDDQKMKAWYYLGRIQENRRELDAASISFLKAEQKAEKSKDLRFKSLVFQSLSNVYSNTYLTDEALRYTKLSYDLSVQAGDSSGAYTSLFRMAQDLHNAGQKAASDSLYRQLIEGDSLDPHLRASLLCDYALILITDREDYAHAAQLFGEVIDTYGSLRSANYWGAYAYALTCTGEAQRANQIFDRLHAMAADASGKFIYDSWKSKADAVSGLYAPAYRLQAEASEIQRENLRRIAKLSAVKAQKDYLEQVHTESATAARKSRYIAWISVVLFLAALLLMFIYIKRREKKHSCEREELLAAYKILTMEHSALASRYSDLSAEFGRIEREKASVRDRYIQSFRSHLVRLGQVNEVLHYYQDTDNALYKNLKNAFKTIGLDDTNAELFENLLNESFDNVMAHFHEDFPDRRVRYYRLVAFLFAGFDAAAICVIIPELKKQNVYVEKYRLRKLIQDSNSKHKEQFLQILS